MKLIVGLGNPGEKYQKNRHNVGFMVMEALKTELRITNYELRKKFNAEISETVHNKTKLILVKPQTFMNNSGEAVSKLASFYKISPQDIWVVSDDIDLPLGTIRIRESGGAGGHKGIESIIEQLGSDSFARFRIGIGPQPTTIPSEKFVLKNFSKNEQPLLDETIQKTVESVVEALEKNLELGSQTVKVSLSEDSD